MRKVFLALFLTMSLVQVAQATSNPAREVAQKRGTESPADGPWDVYDRNGALLRHENYSAYRLDGETKIMYPSGAVKEMITYVDGEREGPTATYYEKGGLMGEGYYKNNNLHGTYKRYYDTGALESVVNYTRGQWDGERKMYYKSGALKQIAGYHNGVISGTVLTYAEDGKVLVEELYNDRGILTSRKDYANDNLLSSTPPLPVAGTPSTIKEKPLK